MENTGEDLSAAAVIEALNSLLTFDLTSEGSTKDPFLGRLQQNLTNLKTRLSDDQFRHLDTALKSTEKELLCNVPGSAVEWQFVATILQLLDLLLSLLSETGKNESKDLTLDEVIAAGKGKPKRPQDAPPLAKSALSMTQINAVKKALQFVVCLGICPNLSPGVGIPPQHRSKLMMLGPLDVTTVTEINLSFEFKKARLSVCAAVLMKLLKVPELKVVVLNAHLNDLLAVLLQMLYACPAVDKKLSVQHSTEKTEMVTETATKNNVCTDQQRMTAQVTEECASTSENNTSIKIVCSSDLQTKKSPSADDKDVYKQNLESLLAGVSHDLLIRELLVLQVGVPRPVQSKRSPGSASLSPPPSWLKKACSQLLLRLVKGSNGILHLYAAMNVGSDPSSPSHWKRCGAVAKIIAGCPVPLSQADQYVHSVSEQLISILHVKEGTAQFIQLLGAVASEMTIKYKEQFHRHFHQPLLQPLRHCAESQRGGMDGRVVVTEKDLTQCLEHVRTVYVRGQQPQAGILSCLHPEVGVLWSLFCLTRSSVYNIKPCVRELIMSYLKFLGRVEAAACLRQLCISQTVDGSSADGCSASLTVRFEAGGNGGLTAVYADAENGLFVSRVTRLSDTQQVEAVIDVLHDLKKDGVAGELLVALLKELTDMVSKETQQQDIVLPVSLESCEVREGKRKELTRRVTLLHLLASICETFESECLTDNTQILVFVKASLERGVAVCRGTSEKEMAIFETETMSMAMGLLTAVMAGAMEMEDKHRHQMDEMLPLLEIIADSHPDEFIKEMAADIRIAIATRGAVWSSLQETKKRNNRCSQVEKPAPVKGEVQIQSDNTRPVSKPLIEVLSDHPAQDSSDSESNNLSAPAKTSLPSEPLVTVASNKPSFTSHISESRSSSVLTSKESIMSGSAVASTDFCSTSSSHAEANSHYESSSANSSAEVVGSPRDSMQTSKEHQTLSGQMDRLSVKQEPEKSSLQIVFEELCDPLLPVRGHALISLAKLVQDKDPETLSKKEVVQKVFEENLRHGDSYLYLASINGMSALADCFPESVVPFLAAEFAGFSKATSPSLTAEHRLKVGEALMKATKNLGEMIPKYRDLLLRAILTGARDEDATVRASSISNLAELCFLLRFSLGSVLHEVFNCCGCLLESDEAIVRQAAALTLAKILEGLDRDALTVLDSVLKNLYHLLKKLHTSDKDDSVRLHANMALVQLDGIAREFLFPKQKLQKKIQILSNDDTFR